MTPNERQSLERLQDYFKNPNLTKNDLKEILWLLKHPEFERMPCQTFSEFVDDPRYLGIGEDTWRKIKIEGDKIWALLLEGKITEAVLLCGYGSGKSFMSAIICLLLVYYLLCLKEPHKNYGLNNDKPIAVINMGVNATQAKNVIFSSLKKFVSNSPAFALYQPEILETEIRFKQKNITLFSGNSKETTPIGMNIFASILDEAAWFLDNDEKSTAENIYNTLKNRIVSRFGDKGFVMIISSVRYAEDFISKKYDQAQNLDYMYSLKLRTWEAKDAEKMSAGTFDFIAESDKNGNPIEVWRGIPVDFKKAFDMNAEKAMRDFGCRPSLVLEAFDRDSSILERIIEERESPVNADNSFKDWFKAQDSDSRYIHIDLALKHDACGFCMGKMAGYELVDGEKRARIFIDLILRIQAKPGKEIQFNEVRQTIYDLQTLGFNIAEVSYDQFQSADSVQILKERGINAYSLSVDRTTEAYDTLKEVIHTKRINVYRDEWFIKEYKRLELVKGKKVDHPLDGSKDVADAVAGVCQMIAGPMKKGGAGFLSYIKSESEEKENKKGYTVQDLLTMYHQQK